MTELQPYQIPLVITFVLLINLVAVPLTSLIIQKTTRWGEISEKYPLRSEFTGEWIKWQTLIFRGWSRAKQCIAIGLSSDFLYVKFMPQILFPYLKPIQIPWTHIIAIKEKNFFLAAYCEFVIQDSPSLTFHLSKGLRKSLQNYSGTAKVVLAFGKQNGTFPESSF